MREFPREQVLALAHSSLGFSGVNLLASAPKADATDSGEGKENANFHVS